MRSSNSLAEALQEMAQSIEAPTRFEEHPVTQLHGRVLSESLHARVQLPDADQSAMDGYAFSYGALSTMPQSALKVVGTSWAGTPMTTTVGAGECARIFTGAVLPHGTDTVVIQENVTASDERVEFRERPGRGANVRYAGEEVSKGAAIIGAGSRLQSEHLGLLVASGHDHATVYARPRVACFSNGDELRPAGADLLPGQLYDSNRFMLNAALQSAGCDVCTSICLPDSRQAIRQALLESADQVDLLITSGGASVGDADHMVSVVEEIGKVQFWKIPIKPGKPVLFGRIGNAWLISLPGNPVSSWVTYHLLVRPLLALLEGRPLWVPLQIRATLSNTIRKHPGRAEYQRGCLTHDADGRPEVNSLTEQGSHRLKNLVHANCLIALEESCDGLEPGASVTVIPFSALRGPT